MKPAISLASVVSWILCASVAHAAAKLEYNRDIRPILAENCFACHGPDSASRKADLRLDKREVAVKAEAIVPGNAEQSELVQRIFATNSGDRMPPRKSKKKLTRAQKETLRRWIQEGAEYQPHWSFIAPKRPAVPAVKKSKWVRNPIDNFILAKLEQNRLQPAPEADRRTLARRLSLDLTGLPPVPADVEAFVKDTRPDAYELYVDTLLRSPHYGEHRARYWLDAARYADTHGIHFDNYREIWTYRDWVIGAFNKNMPLDQFTIEQLAGDLLPNRTLDQLVATGFHRCNITTNEGGVIPEEYLVLYTRDRTETTARVWLGLTAGCAVCHDHKFDPLMQREFYQMAAYFNNTTQGAMDGNIKDTPPVLMVPAAADRPRWETIAKELDQIRRQTGTRSKTARPAFEKWLAGAAAPQIARLIPTQDLRLSAALSEGAGRALTLAVDGKPRTIPLAKDAIWTPGHVAEKALQVQPGTQLELSDAGDFDRGQSFSYGAWIRLSKKQPYGAVLARMDDRNAFRGWDLWIEGGRVGAHIINQWPNDALKVVTQKPIALRQWHHLFITYDGSGRAGGVRVYLDGVSQPTQIMADALKGTTRTTVPLKLAQRNTTSRLDGLSIQDLRLYGRNLSGQEVLGIARGTRAAWLTGKPAGKRTAAENQELFAWWLSAHDTEYQNLTRKLGNLQSEQTAIRNRGSIAYVMQERPEAPTAFILYRGDYDKRRDQVKPATPGVLHPMPADLPRNRLGIARWLMRPENPLTARVTVNRFWQEIFGIGLVKTSEDFGISGELPSHPELLDWLAIEFRDSGWNMKRFFKLLVTSAAYRQAACATPEKLEKDAANRLLSRGPRFRMDAEMVRDYALVASGLLVEKVGGPSVRPYQPEGVWEAVAMIGSNTRDYKADQGPRLYRRSLYTFWKRAAPPASMEIFNAPTREVCTVRRERTNTPLQALVTLNDPQFIEAARYLATRTLKAGKGEEAGIDFMAQRLLARSLRPEELTVVKASLGDLRAFYKANGPDAKKLVAVGASKPDPTLDPGTLAAWTMLANELMNLDEVLNK